MEERWVEKEKGGVVGREEGESEEGERRWGMKKLKK